MLCNFSAYNQIHTMCFTVTYSDKKTVVLSIELQDTPAYIPKALQWTYILAQAHSKLWKEK